MFLRREVADLIGASTHRAGRKVRIFHDPRNCRESAKGEDEENHLHDLIANPEDEADEAVKNLKPEALEGAKATTEMAGGVGAAVLGEKLKSLLIPLR